MLREIDLAGTGRKVACHYAEQVASGEIGVRDRGGMSHD